MISEKLLIRPPRIFDLEHDLKLSLQFRASLNDTQWHATAFDAHDQIPATQNSKQTAAKFPDMALICVAAHRLACYALRNDDAKACPGPFAAQSVNSKFFPGRNGSVPQYAGKVLSAWQSVHPGRVQNCQTANRARPFALRARITALPPRVFMRTRNPWVLFLRVTDGW